MVTGSSKTDAYRRSSVSLSLVRLLQRLAPFIATLALWELFAILSGNQFLPHLNKIVSAILGSFLSDPIIAAQGGGLHGYSWHVLKTLEHFAVCLIAGSGLGFCLTLAVYQWTTARKVLCALILPWEAIPPLMAIPIALAVVGPTAFSNFLAGAFYALVASVVLTTGALEQVPQNYVALAKFRGAGKWWIGVHVYLPAVFVQSLSSLKSVASFTLGIVVVVEYLAAPEGIGRAIKYAMGYHSITLLVAGVFWAVVIGVVFDLLVDVINRYCLRWAWRRS